MARRAAVRTLQVMTYVHITDVSDVSLAEYQKTVDHMGGDPLAADGHLAHIVGETDGGLQIIDVWRSKPHADRFAAEVLFPAFAAVGVQPIGHREVEYDAKVFRARETTSA